MENQQETPQSATDIITWYTVLNEVWAEIKTFFSQWLINALTGNPKEGDY